MYLVALVFERSPNYGLGVNAEYFAAEFARILLLTLQYFYINFFIPL